MVVVCCVFAEVYQAARTHERGALTCFEGYCLVAANCDHLSVCVRVFLHGIKNDDFLVREDELQVQSSK